MPEFIDNQPVKFNILPDVDDCNCDTLQVTQLVNQGDITQFQICINPCLLSQDLVTNGGFNGNLNGWATTGAGWISLDNEACHSGNQQGTLFQAILTQNKYYQVTIEVTENTGVAGDLIVDIGGFTPFTITGIGTFTVSGFANTANFIILAASGADVCVDNVSVFEVQINYIFGVCDKDGNVLTTINLLDSLTPGSEFNPPSINDAQFNLTNGKLTVFIDWTDLGITNGCRSIFILDPCVNQNGQNGVFNGDFTIDDGWIAANVAGGAWVVLAGKGSYAGTGAPSESTFTNDETQVLAGLSYDVTYTLSNMSNTDLTIQLGTAGGTTRNTNGTFSDTIIANGSDFKIFADSTAAGTAEIDDIELSLTNDSDIVKDDISNDFELGVHTCTLLVNGCNDTDQFGFEFDESNFSPTIRLHAKLAKSQYPAERDIERNSRARFTNVFYQRTKTKQLIIDTQPEFVHDFLSLLLGFDHFYIDSIEYFVPEDEEYVPNYDEQDNRGSVEFAVTVKEELIRNVKCQPEGSGCTLPPNFLLNEDDFDDTDFIRLEDGAKIIIVS